MNVHIVQINFFGDGDAQQPESLEAALAEHPNETRLEIKERLLSRLEQIRQEKRQIKHLLGELDKSSNLNTQP